MPLLRIASFERGVDEPAALVILDVRPDFAEDGGVGEVVEVVVLHLEVLAHGDQDVFGLREVVGGGEAGEVEGEGDGEVEGVVGGFVDDDEGVLLHAEVVEVDVVFGGGEEVAGLAELGLESDFVEELHEIYVVLFLPEVLLQQCVDGALEHEGVVDGDHADFGHEVPARLPSPGLRGVHDVVADEEEGLQELDHPAQRCGSEELIGVEVAVEEDSGGVDDREAAITFPAEGVVGEGLGGWASVNGRTDSGLKGGG